MLPFLVSPWNHRVVFQGLALNWASADSVKTLSAPLWDTQPFRQSVEERSRRACMHARTRRQIPTPGLLRGMPMVDWICIQKKQMDKCKLNNKRRIFFSKSTVGNWGVVTVLGLFRAVDCFVSTAVASQAELSEEAALRESAGIHGNDVTHILNVQEVKKNVVGQKSI